ncbi:hypothetical protein ACFL2Z_04865 [Candidatus Eisenbacteria bacterium]|uniref:WD40 repeat domain-containing protein n=1 Tax=Eiseniibacteriota bacterium TaxID=2212470 RepID=A0ABV6YQ65_UNCEI
MRQAPPIVEIAWRAGEPIAIALYDDEVRAYHKDGTRAWSYRAPWELSAFVVARRTGHSVVVSEDERKLSLVDPRGVESFRMEDQDTGCLELAISPDAKHVGLLSNAGQVTWIKTDTEDVWNFTVDDACSIEVSSEAGLLGVGLHNGYSLFGAGGKPIWERDLPKMSVVRSAISPRGDFMALMASPGCRLMVLDRDGSIRFEDFRRFLPKDLALSGAGCFAAAYGMDDADLGVPFSEPVRLDLFGPRETGPLDFRTVASARIRCFDLTPDGTLVTLDPDGIVEAWPRPDRGNERSAEALWSFHTDGEALAISARDKDGPVLTVFWDDDTGEMHFDYRDIREYRHGPA